MASSRLHQNLIILVMVAAILTMLTLGIFLGREAEKLQRQNECTIRVLSVEDLPMEDRLEGYRLCLNSPSSPSA